MEKTSKKPVLLITFDVDQPEYSTISSPDLLTLEVSDYKLSGSLEGIHERVKGAPTN